MVKLNELYKSILTGENEKSRLDLARKRESRKLILRETAIIVFGILGSILLIGIFFGKSGLINVGITFFVVGLCMVLFIIFIMSTSQIFE